MKNKASRHGEVLSVDEYSEKYLASDPQKEQSEKKQDLDARLEQLIRDTFEEVADEIG